MSEEFGEKRTLATVPVFISKPPKSRKPSGLTILLTAANIPLSKYTSIRDALLSVDQVVVGFMINAMNPIRNNHRTKAENVRALFDTLKHDLKVEKYDIVGHSVGGKIALLVASLHNQDGALHNVVALDPVDQSPVEFTNKLSRDNLSLKNCGATSVTVTCTGTGMFLKKEHNGRAIHREGGNIDIVKLINHEGAGHMSYCDDEDGRVSWKSVMNAVDNGDESKNKEAKQEALLLVREKSKSATGKALKALKKDIMAGVEGVQKDVENVASGGAFKSLRKNMLKSMF